MAALWLAIAFPDLGLAVHTRALPPGAAPRPLALVYEGRVLDCNAEAATAGVRSGQRTAAAVALCPPLRFLEALPAEETRLLRQLAEACIGVTPTVVLVPPHSLLLEVGGCLQLFRGHAGLLKQLHRCLRPLAVAYRIAQAPMPKAALVLVASHLAEASLQLPAPLTLQDCLPLLREVSVAALPREAALQKKLDALHFKTLGELLALPRAALSKRLGTAATRYLAQLTGELPDPQQAITLPEEFEATLQFLDGVIHTEALRFPMKRLVDDLCRFLRRRQLSCARFTWRFAHEDRSRQQIVIASARGEPQATRFLQLTELKLEHFRISAPVTAVTLFAQEFQPQGDTRIALLPDPGQEDEKAVALLDRLRARLGADACQIVAVGNSQRPEAEQHLGGIDGFCSPAGLPVSCRSGFSPTSPSNRALQVGLKPDLQKAKAQPRMEIDGQVAPLLPPQPAPRPFWLWSAPKALRLIDGQLWWQGAFTLLSRPERIALPWWEDGDTRDYYLARHDNGGHYWLYFSHEQQAWFCHGVFG